MSAKHNPPYMAIEEIVGLQATLLEYDGDNIKKIINDIQRTNFLKSVTGVRALAKEESELLMIRQKKAGIIADLCVELANVCPAFKQILLQKLFHVARRNAVKIADYKLLIRLYYLNFMTIDEVRKFIKKFPKENENQFFLLIVTFCRELDAYNRTKFEGYLEQISKMTMLPPMSKKFFDEVVMEYWKGKYSTNTDRYKDITQIVIDGYKEGSLPFLIKYDMFEGFERLKRMIDFDYNSTIEPSMFENYDLAMNHPSLISFAALNSSDKIFNFLVKQKVTVRQPDDVGKSIAEFTAVSDSKSAWKWCDIHEIPFDNTLIEATLYRRNENFDRIVAKNHKQNLDLVLFTAAESNNIHALRYCIEHGANCNYCENSDKQTPLHVAAENGNTIIARVLIDTPSVALNAQDIRGRTPLHLASESGNIEIVRMLLNTEGVNTEIRDQYGNTALNLAKP